ncbi:HAD-IIIC family phosphatase [Dactylosporangium sp. NPDC051541]|uniref:HAD-IIIC family phosphatase n=1 Tax=Dactylosporangium sp. NPDC051541 TaxID=3363977 RepID=UPI00378BF0A5
MPDEVLEQLTQLQREGRLAADFPAVRALLRDVTPECLTRAGQLLARLDADEVLRAHPAVPTVKIAVTGHGTLSMLVPPLVAECARHGILARPALSSFDSWIFDLTDPESALYRSDPDLVLCVLDASVVFDEVPAPWRPEDVQRVFAEKTALIVRLANRFQSKARGTLVLNTAPLPRRYPAQLVDYGSRARLGALWREANARLLTLAETHPSIVVVDLDPLVAEGQAASDPRLSVYAKAHLSPGLLAAYAREVGHLARHVTGQTKKVLALDLDGTVWGGILGDDGVEGIEVAESPRGEAFQAFQRVAKQIGSQGVLLAAVSKNEQDLVRQALRDKPGMTLREDDFVRVVANWRPKHDNLAELATVLNVSPDSFVFVDDSAYECGLVRHALPGAAVVQVGEDPARHVEQLLRDGWFDVRELTAEDRARVARYQEEMVRQAFLDTFDSVEDYLKELRVSVRLRAAADADVPRLSQMTLRTNQFNLTTQRLQPADVRQLLADPRALVLAISSADRFGDNGIVGAIFTRFADGVLHIDNFLLSCRVFSRGIEHACLGALLRHARRTGATGAVAQYAPTAKNTIVADLYPRYGFTRTGGDGARAGFRHDLHDIVETPAHVSLTEDLERAAP